MRQMSRPQPAQPLWQRVLIRTIDYCKSVSPNLGPKIGPKSGPQSWAPNFPNWELLLTRRTGTLFGGPAWGSKMQPNFEQVGSEFEKKGSEEKAGKPQTANIFPLEV